MVTRVMWDPLWHSVLPRPVTSFLRVLLSPSYVRKVGPVALILSLELALVVVSRLCFRLGLSCPEPVGLKPAGALAAGGGAAFPSVCRGDWVLTAPADCRAHRWGL